MNERERILDLVKKGIISTDEALNLLESMAKSKETQDDTSSKNTINVNGEEIPIHEDNANHTDHTQEDPERAALEKKLAELAEQAAGLSVKLDGTNEQLHELNQQVRRLDEQQTVFDTMEDLDSLTPEKALERQQGRDELAKVKAKIMMLEDAKESLSNQLNSVKKEQRDNYREKVSQKFQIPDDWKDSANDTFNTVGKNLGDATNQFGKFVKNTVQNVMDNVDWKDVNFKVPGLATTKFDHEFTFPDTKATIINVKNANGDVHFKIWDQADIKVEAHIKLYGKMEESTPLESFETRSTVSVTDDQLTFLVPNKRIQAELTFYLPKRSYDHTTVKLLNGSVDFTEFEGKDLFVKSTNGHLIFDGLNATMLEAEDVNGNIKVQGGSLVDLLASTVNGNIIARTNVESVKASTVNGDVKVTIAEETLMQLTGTSGNGNVKVALPVEMAMKGDTKTSFGAIKSRLSDIEVLENRQGTGHNLFKFQRNMDKAPAELALSTNVGNILLKDYSE